jgi:hypothetical protein
MTLADGPESLSMRALVVGHQPAFDSGPGVVCTTGTEAVEPPAAKMTTSWPARE